MNKIKNITHIPLLSLLAMLSSIVHANDGLSTGIFLYLGLYYGEIAILWIFPAVLGLSILNYLVRKHYVKEDSKSSLHRGPAIYLGVTAIVPLLMLLNFRDMPDQNMVYICTSHLSVAAVSGTIILYKKTTL